MHPTPLTCPGEGAGPAPQPRFSPLTPGSSIRLTTLPRHWAKPHTKVVYLFISKMKTITRWKNFCILLWFIKLINISKMEWKSKGKHDFKKITAGFMKILSFFFFWHSMFYEVICYTHMTTSVFLHVRKSFQRDNNATHNTFHSTDIYNLRF